jgi:hypothetical protein
MKIQEILRLRLHNQHISSRCFATPEAVVSWLGAAQAQDYAGAKWSVGLRIENATETDVEKAISDRSIVRTWPMRGTLHFVAADDVRWMLQLLAPRIISGMAGRNRQLELDEKIFNKSRDLLTAQMQGGKQLMRSEVYDVLEKNGIHTSEMRGMHIINYLAQTQILCHGFHNDKQATYVLLDEWVPKSKMLDQEEALAEIALRYFSSHGPATVQDFVWWTGLKISDAKRALESVKHQLLAIEAEGTTFWSSAELPDSVPAKSVHLLPGFDEYMLGYTNRGLMVPQDHMGKIVPGNNGMFMPTIVIDGQVKGLWKRSFIKDKAKIDLTAFAKFTKGNIDQINLLARKYGRYIGKDILIN